MKKIQSVLGFILMLTPAIIPIVFGILTYISDQKNYDLEVEKFSAGSIPKKELRVTTFRASDVLGALKSLTGPPFKVTMDLEGNEINSLFSVMYTIENPGKAPILKSDFSEKLTLSYPKKWKIVFIESGLEFSTPQDLDPVWEKSNDNEVQLKPMLINPKDRFTITVYLSNIDKKTIELKQIKKEL